MSKNSIYRNKVINLLLILLCIYSVDITNCIAQDRQELPEVSDEIKNFITTSDSISKIEQFIRDEKNSDIALTYSQLFLKRGIEENDPRIQFFSSYVLSFISYNRNDYVNSIKNGTLAYEAALQMRDTVRTHMGSSLLGSSYYNLGMYDEAIKAYIKSKNVKSIDSLRFNPSILVNIANCRFKIGKYHRALNDYNKVIHAIEKNPEVAFVQKHYSYLAAFTGKIKCLTEIGKYNEATATCREGIKFSKQQNFTAYNGYFHFYLGYIQLKQQNFKSAIAYIQQGNDLIDTAKNVIQGNVQIANYFAAQAHFQLEEYDTALTLLDKNFKEIGDNIYAQKIEEMYDLAIKISKVTNHTEQQLLYHNKLREVIEAKHEKQNLAKDILYDDDIKNFETDLNNFKIENKKLNEVNTKTTLNKNLILFISSLLFIILLSGFYAYRKKVKRDKQIFLDIISDIENRKKVEKSEKKTIVITSNEIKDEKAAEILNKLQDIEETHFYLSQDCNLYSTAKLIETNTTYLSKTLNETKKQTFNQYLNELRINYILVKLKEDTIFRSYTIRAIAKEIGYKSHTTFIKVFKNKTGVTPAYYIKNLDLV